MAALTLYFDVVCPFAYIGASKVAAAARRLGVHVTWKPVVLGGLYEATKAPQGKAGSASDVMPPAKLLLQRQDLVREARAAGVPLYWNKKHPVSSVKALRLILGAPEHQREVVALDLFRTYWQLQGDVSDTAVLEKIADRHGVPMSVIETAAVKDELRANTEEAAARGAFGVPSWWVPKAEKLFWGQDRLSFALHAAGVPRSLSGPFGNFKLVDRPAKPRVLKFFYDFSSPFAYLGSTAVEALARDHGAQLEYVPILLGALFNEIGTPNVPAAAMPEAKRNYMSRDLQDWAEWRGIRDFKFPSAFPLRTVTPLRVAIANPSTVNVLFNAAWTQDQNIGDTEVLTTVLTDAGFDAPSLLAAAGTAAIKDALKANTTKAISLGVCGVPTFQVDDGELVWGQDRMHVVADLLCGWTGEQLPPASKL